MSCKRAVTAGTNLLRSLANAVFVISRNMFQKPLRMAINCGSQRRLQPRNLLFQKHMFGEQGSIKTAYPYSASTVLAVPTSTARPLHFYVGNLPGDMSSSAVISTFEIGSIALFASGNIDVARNDRFSTAANNQRRMALKADL